MLSHHRPARPLTMGAATACAILRDATTRLDAIRADAEREILNHVRSRDAIEALIARLIDGLDQADAPDDDLEGLPAGQGTSDLDVDNEEVEGDELDAGEATNEDGDELALGEVDRTDVPHDWKADCGGILMSFKRGQLVHVHARAREGRAAR